MSITQAKALALLRHCFSTGTEAAASIAKAVFLLYRETALQLNVRISFDVPGTCRWTIPDFRRTPIFRSRETQPGGWEVGMGGGLQAAQHGAECERQAAAELDRAQRILREARKHNHAIKAQSRNQLDGGVERACAMP